MHTPLERQQQRRIRIYIALRSSIYTENIMFFSRGFFDCVCVSVSMSVMGVRAFEWENDSERQNERACICVFVYCWLAGCFGWGAFRSKNTHRHTHQQGDGWHLFCVLFFAEGNAQRSFDFHATHTHTHTLTTALERATTIHFLPQLVWGGKNCLCLSKFPNHLYFFM